MCRDVMRREEELRVEESVGKEREEEEEKEEVAERGSHVESEWASMGAR